MTAKKPSHHQEQAASPLGLSLFDQLARANGFDATDKAIVEAEARDRELCEQEDITLEELDRRRTELRGKFQRSINTFNRGGPSCLLPPIVVLGSNGKSYSWQAQKEELCIERKRGGHEWRAPRAPGPGRAVSAQEHAIRSAEAQLGKEVSKALRICDLADRRKKATLARKARAGDLAVRVLERHKELAQLGRRRNAALAQEFGLTIRQIQRIVSGERGAKRDITENR